MSVLIFYRTQGEHARRVEDFLRDFNRRTGSEIEQINPDSSRGSELSRLYDVVEYPTIVATAKDGQMRNMWRGITLPTIDEVSYYVEHDI